VRIAQDISVTAAGAAHLGEVAREVRDRGIALEVCPTSNVQTGAVASMPEHPLAWLDALGLLVTINPDNRLMCGVGVSHEMRVAGGLRRGRVSGTGAGTAASTGQGAGTGTAAGAGSGSVHAPEAQRRFDGVAARDTAAPEVDRAAMLRWTRNAVDSAFATHDVKHQLRARIDDLVGSA